MDLRDKFSEVLQTLLKYGFKINSLNNPNLPNEDAILRDICSLFPALEINIKKETDNEKLFFQLIQYVIWNIAYYTNQQINYYFRNNPNDIDIILKIITSNDELNAENNLPEILQNCLQFCSQTLDVFKDNLFVDWVFVVPHPHPHDHYKTKIDIPEEFINGSRNPNSKDYDSNLKNIMKKNLGKEYDGCINPITGREYDIDYIKEQLDSNSSDVLSAKFFSSNFLMQLYIYHRMCFNHVLIVSGSTGVGKSTEFPKIYFNGIIRLSQIGIIDYNSVLISEPRQIPTAENCNRINKSFGIEKNNNIHYIHGEIDTNNDEIGTQSHQSEHYNEEEEVIQTCIFKTDQLVLMDMSGEKRAIIIDEFHEHNINMDMIVSMFKTIYIKAAIDEIPHLILISATIKNDRKRIKEFFQHLSVNEILIEDPAQKIRYNIIIKQDPVPFDLRMNASFLIKKIREIKQHIFAEGIDGRVLCVFLPQKKLINQIVSQLKIKFKDDIIYPLYSKNDNKDALTIAPPPNSWKIIVSTDIAEASLTIDNLVGIIDTGILNYVSYDPLLKCSISELKEISQDSSIQRKGRVGRTQDGIVYRLYDFDKLESSNKTKIESDDVTYHIVGGYIDKYNYTDTTVLFNLPNEKIFESNIIDLSFFEKKLIVNINNYLSNTNSQKEFNIYEFLCLALFAVKNNSTFKQAYYILKNINTNKSYNQLLSEEVYSDLTSQYLFDNLLVDLDGRPKQLKVIENGSVISRRLQNDEDIYPYCYEIKNCLSRIINVSSFEDCIKTAYPFKLYRVINNRTLIRVRTGEIIHNVVHKFRTTEEIFIWSFTKRKDDAIYPSEFVL